MSIFERAPKAYTQGEMIERGFRAERLLDDEMFREAYEGAQWALVEGWVNQNGTSLEHRETCWAGLHAMEAIRQRLREIASEGEFARVKDKQ